MKRRNAQTTAIVVNNDFTESLIHAGNAYIVKRDDDHRRVSVVHNNWGRDTFIALPGLTLVTGRFDEAKAMLKAFSKA